MSDFRERPDLAAERLGGTVLWANDDFFAEKENLLKAAKPVWKEHEYTDRGKWMDGWESRRKRGPGHDTALIRLGLPGIVRGVVVDTAYFRGNYPAECSIEGCVAPPETPVETLLAAGTEWVELLPRSPLAGDSENLFDVRVPAAVTHLKFHIYPDGGVARLRVHGEVLPDWRRAGGLAREIDLAALENGAQVLSCSDMFFGGKHNLIQPGRAANMSDGWETRRRRGPGNDWVIVRLAHEGTLARIEIDTNHFKGNFPDTAAILGCNVATDAEVPHAECHDVLPRTKLMAHTRHLFGDELAWRGPLTHVRLEVHPDGGVSRLRVWGTPTAAAVERETARRLEALPRDARERELAACCASREWARRVADAAPYGSWEALRGAAERVWRELPPDAWREAFGAHPRLGARGGSAWSQQEQSGSGAADAALLDELTRGNEEYERRFGHVFLLCATGTTAPQMLAALRERLGRSPDEELATAAEEQRKITELRLRKLVAG